MIDYFELRRSVMEKEVVSKNFIEQIIEKDLAEGKYETICTRFPPEPNGYLHIGHAKSILLNYGLSQEYNGKFNLRFDDTNPTKEKIEFVESIQADVKWLGADWEDRLFFASNYFDQMYEAAIKLIKKGKAFVCDLTAEQIREYRGTLTEPGKNSPYRDRSVEENLDLFERMKNGEFEDGTKVLRAKIDMASPNINMRDPVIYRVAHMTHHNTGDKWCIYPMYDFAHPIEDAIEGVTHSICTLEFEDHRPLYDWVVRELEYQYPPKQIEFAKLYLTNVVTGKRYIKRLVEEGIVDGWDDPRLVSIAALRRRGFTPESIKRFVELCGISKSNSSVDYAMLEYCIREDLKMKKPRMMAVLDPIKLVITNYPEGRVEYLDVYDYLPTIIFTDTERKQKGFRAQYFDNMNLEGTPKVEQTETKINYSWSGGTGLKEMPKEQFSVRWNGTICPQETDEYLFTLGGDDGYRLYIDGKLIADEWHEGAFRNSTYRCMLEAGKKYDLKIEYFQKGGGAAVNFIWKQKNASNNLFVEALNRNDLVVACIGFNSDTEGEGRDRTFELPEDEAQLLQNTLQSKRPVVGIVNAGGNVEMQSWEPSLKGLLWAWYGGQEAGTAIARTLFGELNPSGKLPVTFEKRWEDNPTFHSYYDPDGDKHVEYTEGIFVGYRGYDKLKREVQYPFGYGLSYTRFKLSAPTVGTPKTDGSVTVTCKLTNTGRTAGAEVVQLYVSNKDTTVEHPEKELKGFRKVYLEPGETKSIEITVPAEAFSHYDTGSRRFVIDRGSHDILLGFSSRDIKAKMSVGISR